jgi:hypothetical protein
MLTILRVELALSCRRRSSCGCLANRSAVSDQAIFATLRMGRPVYPLPRMAHPTSRRKAPTSAKSNSQNFLSRFMEARVVPTGLDSYSLGLTQDSRPGLLYAAPTGLESCVFEEVKIPTLTSQTRVGFRIRLFLRG